MKKIAILAMTAALSLAACATGPTHNAQDADSAITAAKHELSRAADMQAAWRDTGKMIKKAEKLSKEGKFDKAVSLANEAKMQSTIAMQQAAEQRDAEPRF